MVVDSSFITGSKYFDFRRFECNFIWVATRTQCSYTIVRNIYNCRDKKEGDHKIDSSGWQTKDLQKKY